MIIYPLKYLFVQIRKLREELITAQNAAGEEKLQREKYEAKLKDLEQKLNNICTTGMISEIKARKHYYIIMYVLNFNVIYSKFELKK